MKDLLILAADADIEATMDVLLTKRQPSLGIRGIDFRIVRHLKRDSECRKLAAETARSFTKRYRYVLVLFDKDRSGGEGKERQLIQCAVEEELGRAGWENRAKAIVIEPELETWVWSKSPHVEKVLGWNGGKGQIRKWLCEQDLWPDETKPPDPKLAMRRAMGKGNLSPKATTFKELAERVSLDRCEDTAFLEVRETLQGWFPAHGLGF